MHRWEETRKWAAKNGCIKLVSGISDRDFYFVEEPTSYVIGPMGGPMYRPCDFDAKNRPSSTQINQCMEILLLRWHEIVGPDLALITKPLSFIGKKARRLLVAVEAGTAPPWGGWSHLSTVELKRRTFTRFRGAINKAIALHEVDHIDFITKDKVEKGTL